MASVTNGCKCEQALGDSGGLGSQVCRSPWVAKGHSQRSDWKRERLPTPVCWPGEFHGLYSPWGHKESDMTEQLSLHFTYQLKNNSKNSDS